MPAEATHKVGRDGVIQAKLHLERVLGQNVSLPYNAYDAPQRLRFDGGAELGEFFFDLRGTLRRPDKAALVDGMAATDLFVEVKNYSNGAKLLDEFRGFLKRSAVASSAPEHSDTWFLFFATVPFGCSHGSSLCDGTLLQKEANRWPQELKTQASSLRERIVAVINTRSEARFLDQWWTPRQLRGAPTV